MRRLRDAAILVAQIVVAQVIGEDEYHVRLCWHGLYGGESHRHRPEAGEGDGHGQRLIQLSIELMGTGLAMGLAQELGVGPSCWVGAEGRG